MFSGGSRRIFFLIIFLRISFFFFFLQGSPGLPKPEQIYSWRVMAERGAPWLLSLLWLTFLHAAAKHVDKGKSFSRTAAPPVASACCFCKGGEMRSADWLFFFSFFFWVGGLEAFSFCRTFKQGCVFISGALLTHPAAPPPSPARLGSINQHVFQLWPLLFAEAGVHTSSPADRGASALLRTSRASKVKQRLFAGLRPPGSSPSAAAAAAAEEEKPKKPGREPASSPQPAEEQPQPRCSGPADGWGAEGPAPQGGVGGAAALFQLVVRNSTRSSGGTFFWVFFFLRISSRLLAALSGKGTGSFRPEPWSFGPDHRVTSVSL